MVERQSLTDCILIAPTKHICELGQGGDMMEWQESLLSGLLSILVSLSTSLKPGQWVDELAELNFLVARWLNYIYHLQCLWINMSQLVPHTVALVMASQERRWWNILYPVLLLAYGTFLQCYLSIALRVPWEQVSVITQQILPPDLVPDVIWCWAGSRTQIF